MVQSAGESKWRRGLIAAMATAGTLTTSAIAAPMPDFMNILSVSDDPPASKSAVAFSNVRALNDGMFSIYDNAQGIYRKNFLGKHPLIMGLFSGRGGRFILYRPGQPPLEAESPPPIYVLTKSVGHCALTTYQIVAPYITESAADQSWRAPMQAYRTRVVSAMDSLNDVDCKPDERDLMRSTLQKILTFMDSCLANGKFTYDEVQAYARGIQPDLTRGINIASAAQVEHWYQVLERWKAMLGPQWDDTYALSNSIYVARQNNILFSVLVQFMGEKTINDRLILLETTDFTATPEDMIKAFISIVSDRASGQVFFNNYRMMDYELLGSGGRAAIKAAAERRGQKALLPPLVPFNSNAWPWKTDPGSGTGPALIEDIH